MPEHESADWSFGSSLWLKPHRSESALVSGFRSLKAHENWKALVKRRKAESFIICVVTPLVCAGTYQPFWPGFQKVTHIFHSYFICLHQRFSSCGPRMLVTLKTLSRDPPGKTKTLHDHTKTSFTLYPLISSRKYKWWILEAEACSDSWWTHACAFMGFESLSTLISPVGKPGVLQAMGSQRVGHNWATEQQQILIDVNHVNKSSLGIFSNF